MTRKPFILSLSLAAGLGLAASKASAQLLPGNVWPNPTLSTQAPAGPDPQYGSDESNPRPNGWHRGGNDFGTTTTPMIDFWTPTPAVVGNTPSPNPVSAAPLGAYLSVNDSNTNGYGEWFSDFNALPASSILTGTPFNFQYYWQYNSLMPTGKSPDDVRVTVNWADASGNGVGSPSHVDELVPTNTPDLNTWTAVEQLLTPPVNAATMNVTIDSGGGSEVTGNIYVADISAASVPEPASLGLLTGAALMFARRRRRV